MKENILNPSPAVAEEVAQPPQHSDIEGNVERIEPAIIVGWVHSHSNEPVHLSLQVDGYEYVQECIWHDRADVAEVLGIDALKSGFQILPTEDFKTLLTLEDLDEKTIIVLANGHDLPKAETAFRRQPLASESSAISTGTKPLRAYIDPWLPFTICGWVVLPETQPTLLEVTVNGTPIQCNIIRVDRKDVEEALGGEYPKAGFEIELPGYVWELAGDGDSCKIQLHVNTQELTLAPMVLSHNKVIQWIHEIAELKDEHELRYFSMLALEHVRYGGFFTSLDSQAKRFVQEFARSMQLEEFTFSEESEQSDADPPTESLANVLLWRALRTLNERLSDDENSGKFDVVKAVMHDLRLSGEVKERFVLSVTPLLCTSGEFFRLHELTELSHLQKLHTSDDLWEMTLSIPALITDRRIRRASEVLYSAAKALDKGWLNTECIHYSMQLLLDMEVDGKIETNEAEQFRYAFVGLLDAFNGEWFSRLHDLKLIDTMLFLLANIDRFTDYNRQDLVGAAQRVYGLNPTFWQRLEQQKQTCPFELGYGHGQFKKLHAAFIDRHTALTDCLDEVAEPLSFFRSKNNPEALIYLREICAHCLSEFNETLPTQGKILLSDLLASNPAEALRIAAFPLIPDNRLLETFPETTAAMLHQNLRNLSDSSNSITWHLQKDASNMLRALLSATHNNERTTVITELLVMIEQRSVHLANLEGNFLAFDLLASAYVIASQHGLNASSLLTCMSWILKKAAEETKNDWFLPAPILAGISRLHTIQNQKDLLLHSFLADCRSQIKTNFGERMTSLFAMPQQPQLSSGPTGWPSDTLVIIYSCRKYLDTRIQAIRATWIEDLKVRGIPYLVMVGDGDDTIEGDVLALDVSDKYEDLPQKTLKLVDWVYHNTDAQYVLKIDDDCFLNVASFFDTLSYRKHFYYGRVIRRGVGSMDRAWHQPKSHTPHGQKTLDKSPEPSVYADGGGGYTLSRLAMQQLLKNKETPAGERLISCSFMEDKLIGDLLAMSFIAPSNEDYITYQRRRTFAGAMPVGKVENTFYPSEATPVMMTHLDNEHDLAPTHALNDSKELWPKKLWPTCRPPGITANCNQLELLSEVTTTSSLLKQDLLVVSVVRNEIIMLPHFLAHYRLLGVKCFVFVDNCSDDSTREYLFEQPDVVLYSSDTEYKYSQYGVAWQQTILGNLCLGKWVVLADADELLVYPECESRSLIEFIADVNAEGANAVLTPLMDMYPYENLTDADFSKQNPFIAAPYFDQHPLIDWRLGSGVYSNGPTYQSAMRQRLSEASPPNAFTSQKYGLVRYQPWLRYSQGLHDVANATVFSQTAWFAHFKYHIGFKKKVETEIRRGQHFNNASEYRRYAAMLAESHGGFGAEGVSIQYQDSHTFRGLDNFKRWAQEAAK